MPTECPKCGVESFGYEDDKNGKPGPIELIEDDQEGWIPISTTLCCRKCGFKWIQFYEESEWTSFEEYEGESWCSWRSPKKPYNETLREPPYTSLSESNV